MRTRDFDCRSYQTAVSLLRSRPERKVCNNTYLRRDAVTGGIGVYLHGHQIVLFQEDKPVRISSCGWRTVTTKQRINCCLPDQCYLYQVQGDWLVDMMRVESGTGHMKPVPHDFFDGMEVE